MIIRAALALLAAYLGSCATTQSVVRGMTFPSNRGASNGRDFPLSVAAILVPTLVVGYRNPLGASQCLRDILRPPTSTVCARNTPLRRLFYFGACMTHPKIPPAQGETAAYRWCMCYRDRILPLFAGGSTAAASVDCPLCPASDPAGTGGRSLSAALATTTMPASCASLDERDRALVRVALADAGEAIYRYDLSLWPADNFLDRDVECGAEQAVRNAIGLLAHDPYGRPGCPSGSCTERSRYPTLALSGGAANGAFTAGYLHQLLRLRELARRVSPHANDIDDDERFGGVTGTSVGALLAGVVDLYFSERPSNSHPQLEALRTMVRDLTELSEWNLLCFEPGDALALAGMGLGGRTISNLLRFTPLHDEIVVPFFQQWGTRVLDNDFVRIVMSVDLIQNVVLGLDERACRAITDLQVRLRCLSDGILASIVEPVMAERVSRVYSGLRGDRGEEGFWYDGGLRSGTPALRALQLTDGFSFEPSTANGRRDPIHVLAVSTNRAEGIPRVPQNVQSGLDVVFATLGSFADQTRTWELAYASQFAVLRADRIQMINERPGYTAAGLNAIWSAFLPESAPASIAADAYTFNPATMLGLFLVGEQTMLGTAEAVLAGLEWRHTLQAIRVGGASSILSQERAGVAQRYLGWSQFMAGPDRTAYDRDREHAFDACMRYCGQGRNSDPQCNFARWNQRLNAFRPPPL